jgi:hypothetical protein
MSLWASRWRTMTKLPIGGVPGYPQRVSDLTPAMPLLARLADQVVFVGVQGSRKRADEFQGIQGTSPLKPPSLVTLEACVRKPSDGLGIDIRH